ncbi:MAG: ribonuclease HIII [Atopococcus tabaci]|uniref:Ribonuclease HIII n=1 Tax=Atopococcus tabaci TaxID=269774 RepID=A0AA43RM13_9LACT|nr:ribonuclease HIII [Atopococcus tabaci]
MQTITLTMNPQELKKAEKYYEGHKKAKKPDYSIFQAKKDKVTITAYHTGKVVFQGQSAEEEASIWGTLPPPKKENSKQTSLPHGFDQWSVLGSDEVGNGSYFGPLTVCAAYVSRKNLSLIKELGVRDSKSLSDVQIRSIAQDIKACIPYKLLVVKPAKYNQIQPQMTQNKMKALLHNQALGFVLKEVSPEEPEAVLIDQFEAPKNYLKHIEGSPDPVTQKLYFATQGESVHLAVAAASIIARDQFLEEMDILSEQAGMKLPGGANALVDETAAKILLNPHLKLGKFAKLHFANTQKAQKIVQKIRNRS